MENKIKEIFETTFQTTSNHSGLISGLPGQLLLSLEYYVENGLAFDDEFTHLLQHIIDGITAYPVANFSGGKSGINWFFGYLFKKGFIDKEDYQNICCDAPLLQEVSLSGLDKGNWDFLHGAIGIAYSLLFDYKKAYKEYFSLFLKKLEQISTSNGETHMLPNFHFEAQTYIKEEVNLGLAHGIPSVLKFCIECYKKNVCQRESKRMAQEIINFLFAHTNIDTGISFYPSVAQKGNTKEAPSRLAWCYGDLGIGIILYQAGTVFRDQKVIDFSLKILKYSTKRRSVEDTFVFDAGICHGSAGVAHIYNKMWHYTKDPVFKEATDYWIQKTLDFAVHEDGIAGYKRYNPQDKTWVAETGLLEGAAGIGLVLLSYISGNFGWDYCLMLND